MRTRRIPAGGPAGEELGQGGGDLLGVLLGKEVSARQRAALDVVGALSRDRQQLVPGVDRTDLDLAHDEAGRGAVLLADRVHPRRVPGAG